MGPLPNPGPLATPALPPGTPPRPHDALGHWTGPTGPPPGRKEKKEKRE